MKEQNQIPEIQKVRLGEWTLVSFQVERDTSSPVYTATLAKFEVEQLGPAILRAWTTQGLISEDNDTIYTPFGPVLEGDANGQIQMPLCESVLLEKVTPSHKIENLICSLKIGGLTTLLKIYSAEFCEPDNMAFQEKGYSVLHSAEWHLEDSGLEKGGSIYFRLLDLPKLIQTPTQIKFEYKKDHKTSESIEEPVPGRALAGVR